MIAITLTSEQPIITIAIAIAIIIAHLISSIWEVSKSSPTILN